MKYQVEIIKKDVYIVEAETEEEEREFVDAFDYTVYTKEIFVPDEEGKFCLFI